MHRPAGRRHQLGHRPAVGRRPRRTGPASAPEGRLSGRSGRGSTVPVTVGPCRRGTGAAGQRPEQLGTPAHTAAATSLRARPVHHQPRGRRLGGQVPVAVGHPLVELVALALEPVAGVARPPAPAATATGTSTSTVRSGRSPPVAHSTSVAARPGRAPVRSPGRPASRREPVGDHPAALRRGPGRSPRPRAGPGRPPSAAPRPARSPAAVTVEEQGPQRRPSRVAPGSKVKTAPSRSARRRAWVVLPQPSMPSRAMRRPRRAFGHPGLLVLGRSTGATGSGRGLLAPRAFFAARLLGRGLLGRCLLRPRPSWPAAFLAGAFLAAFLRVEGPAARRSARSSEARSTVRLSTSSPRRSEALVVPSVT